MTPYNIQNMAEYNINYAFARCICDILRIDTKKIYLKGIY